MGFYIYQWFWSALDLLYPPYCGGCGSRGSRWCQSCQQKTTKIKPPLCPRCGQSQATGSICSSCRRAPPKYTALRSWAVFAEPLRSAIHRLKYKRDIALGEVLSRHLISSLAATAWKPDMVVPVPLGLARLEE